VRRQALWSLALVAAIGTGTAGGCSHPPAPPAKVAALPPLPPPVVVVPRPHPIPLPARKPPPPPEPAGAQDTADEAAAGVELQPAPNASIPPYPAQSSELIGLDQASAVRLFGAAAEKSEKPPATVWKWRSGTCELDLYFYLDLRSGRMRSLHYVFLGDATGQPDCLKSLALAARG
jgi:hypothetical protein